MISQELREVMEKIESLKPEWKLAQGALPRLDLEFRPGSFGGAPGDSFPGCGLFAPAPIPAGD